MSHWTARLPYAHRYITKTLFEGAEADLDLPEEITSMDPIHEMPPTHMHRRVYSRCSTTVHLERIKRYYYEVSVSLGVQRSKSYEWLTIGYTTPLAAIRYANDGAVFTNTPGDQGHVAIPYGAGDIIGCGYEYPSRFFFTKNGIYLGHCIAHLGLNALRPEVRRWSMIIDFHEPMNFGQRPFMFDIEGYFDKRCARLQTLSTDLPLEILEDILQFALLSEGTNHILRLSRVCRRWRTLLSRSVLELSLFTRKDLEDVLKILRTPIPIRARNLTTQESSDEMWLHLFLASPLSIKSTSKLAIRTSARYRRFLNEAPSFLSQGVPGLLRHTFPEVHILELSGYSFPTWTRFVQVVFALQRLETLVCKSVTWNSGPPTPPTWLTFSKRLRHASFEHMGGQYIAGSLWLFLAGRPRQPSNDLVLLPSDVSTIGELASLLLTPSFTSPRNQDFAFSRDYIIYDQKQDQPRSCTFSFKRQSRSVDATDLSFQFEGNGVTYRVTRVYVRPALQAFRIPDDCTLREIGRCWTALSSANLCHFRFELSGIQPTGGLHHRRRVAKAMLQKHSAGLLECTWHGETIEDTKGVRWLKPGTAVTFGVEKTYKRGTSGRLTWDPAGALHPQSFFKNIPWLKLYKHDDQITSGQFIADVAFDIDAESGQADFSLPDSAAPGLYFLVVGDYVYRTEYFEIVQ